MCALVHVCMCAHVHVCIWCICRIKLPTCIFKCDDFKKHSMRSRISLQIRALDAVKQIEVKSLQWKKRVIDILVKLKLAEIQVSSLEYLPFFKGTSEDRELYKSWVMPFNFLVTYSKELFSLLDTTLDQFEIKKLLGKIRETVNEWNSVCLTGMIRSLTGTQNRTLSTPSPLNIESEAEQIDAYMHSWTQTETALFAGFTVMRGDLRTFFEAFAVLDSCTEGNDELSRSFKEWVGEFRRDTSKLQTYLLHWCLDRRDTDALMVDMIILLLLLLKTNVELFNERIFTKLHEAVYQNGVEGLTAFFSGKFKEKLSCRGIEEVGRIFQKLLTS